MHDELKDQIAAVMGYTKKRKTYTVPHGSAKGETFECDVYYAGDRIVDDIDLMSWSTLMEVAKRTGLSALPTDKDEAEVVLSLQFIFNNNLVK